MAPPPLGVVAHEDGTVSIDEVDEELHPTLQDRLEYLLLRLLGFSVSLLPRFLALALAWLIGVFFFEFLRIRRGVTISNLQQAFPDETPSWHRRTARAAYVNLAVVSVEMLRAHSLDTGKVNALVHLDGETERRLRAVLDSSTGAVFVSGHYGTWELLGSRIAALGYPSIAIMQDQRNPLMNRELNEMRSELGLEVVERRVAPKKVMKTLREGGLVLIVGDQDHVGWYLAGGAELIEILLRSADRDLRQPFSRILALEGKAAPRVILTPLRRHSHADGNRNVLLPHAPEDRECGRDFADFRFHLDSGNQAANLDGSRRLHAGRHVAQVT